MNSPSEISNSGIAAAVIGTGFIGPVHLEALRRNGIPVVGILGSNHEKTLAAARVYGIPRAYQSLDELLADPAVSAVHITTPNRFHFSQASAALHAGKHVLCEKPLGMNSRETGELVELARAQLRVAAVAYNIRFYPLCHHAAQLVREQQLGEILHVQGSYTQDWLLKETDFNWRVLGSEGGPLRAVADIGTHWLDLVQYIVGQKIVSVLADLKTVHAERFRPPGGRETFASLEDNDATFESVSIDTEDCGAILFRFSGGANGSLWVSQTTAGRKNCLRYEIAGSRQAIHWNSETPNELWIGNRDRANENLIRDPALMNDSAAAVTAYPGGHNEGFPDTFKQLIHSFYSFIARDDPDAPIDFPTFADGHYEVTLCEAILESHRNQRWVHL